MVGGEALHLPAGWRQRIGIGLFGLLHDFLNMTRPHVFGSLTSRGGMGYRFDELRGRNSSKRRRFAASGGSSEATRAKRRRFRTGIWFDSKSQLLKVSAMLQSAPIFIPSDDVSIVLLAEMQALYRPFATTATDNLSTALPPPPHLPLCITLASNLTVHECASL